jgi:enoyl-CoA hydratase/carnithine racemase
LAASCDLVVAAEGARFGYPEGRTGLVGVTAVAPLLGRQWATFLMITGELITAEQARSLGLVLAVEPDDEVHPRADDLARRIARMPRAAVQLNRRAIDAALEAGGLASARAAARPADAATLRAAATATAPEGRTFRSILDEEGMEGMKAAREAQYTTPWLRDRDGRS